MNADRYGSIRYLLKLKNLANMEKNSKYFDVHRARIYKDLYKPSTNLSRFFKSVLGILLIGKSPISKHDHYFTRKK